MEQGDNTLKEANNTYNKLAGFQSEVQRSSETAAQALQTVPNIEKEIQNAESLIGQAEDALAGANKNANEAKKNAQEAQMKYAEQASKVGLGFIFLILLLKPFFSTGCRAYSPQGQRDQGGGPEPA